MLIHRRRGTLLVANPKFAADMTLVNLDFDYLFKTINAHENRLANVSGGGTTTIIQPGGEGLYDWSNLYKAGTSISARQAFGDWVSGMEDLVTHIQKTVDPHSSHPQWTVGVKTPLVDAAANLNLLPAAGSQVTVGDTAAGGVFRPVVIADLAYQVRSYGEALKVAAAPTITAGTILANVEFYPNYTGTTYAANTGNFLLEFDGTNKSNTNSEALCAGIVLNGSAAHPAVGVAGTQPYAAQDVNLTLGTSYSGSVAKLAGIWLHPAYLAGASGTVTELYMIEGQALDAIATAGKVGTFGWFNFPTPSANVANSYLGVFGAGNIRLDGDVGWVASDGTQILHMDTSGRIGLGGNTAPGDFIDLDLGEGTWGGIRFNGYSTASGYGQQIFRRARGTKASPTATQVNDALGSLSFIGYGATGWNAATASIAAIAIENFTDAAEGGYLAFHTTAAGTTARTGTAVLYLDGANSRWWSPVANMEVGSNVVGSGGVLYAKLTNKTGTDRVAGEIVIATETNNSFVATTTANSTLVIGILLEDIANNASGRVAIGGGVVTVECDASAVTRGQFLGTSTTLGHANPTTTAGAKFCKAITAKGAGGHGEVQAIICTG